MTSLTDERWLQPDRRARRPPAAGARTAARARRGGRCSPTAGCSSSPPTTPRGACSVCPASRSRWPTGGARSRRCWWRSTIPGVDGVLGSADIIEDLALLGALDGKLAFGTMNRGGVMGASWELDDRMTAYDAQAIAECGLDGGKVLLRLADDDAGTASTIEACARAVSECARRGLPIMVEPLPYHHESTGSGQAARRRRRAAPRGRGRRQPRLHQLVDLAEGPGRQGPGAACWRARRCRH